MIVTGFASQTVMAMEFVTRMKSKGAPMRRLAISTQPLQTRMGLANTRSTDTIASAIV
jgi:hypothetical protein